MNRDDVMQLALDVGASCDTHSMGMCTSVMFSIGQLERFAALVAAAERRKHQTDIETWKHEACKAEKWRGLALSKDPMGAGRVVQAIQREAMELEREACARVCEDRAGTVSMFGTAKECAAHNGAIGDCATAIRARG